MLKEEVSDECHAEVSKASDIPVTDESGEVPQAAESYIQERLDRVPLHLLQNLCEVILTEFGRKEVYGEYHGPYGEIHLKRTDLHRVADNTPILFHVDRNVYHELAHHVWDVILTDTEREEYTRIISQDPNAAHLLEDLPHTFVHDFVAYILAPPPMRSGDARFRVTFSQSYQFLKAHVFRGAEFLSSSNPHFDNVYMSLFPYARGLQTNDVDNFTRASTFEQYYDDFVQFAGSAPSEEQAVYILDLLARHAEGGNADVFPILEVYFQVLINENTNGEFVDPSILDFYYGWFLLLKSTRSTDLASGERRECTTEGRTLLEDVAQSGPTPEYRQAALLVLDQFESLQP
jgi:hypothetical protein